MIFVFDIIATICSLIVPIEIWFRLYGKREYEVKPFLTGAIVSFILNYLVLTFYNNYFQSVISLDNGNFIINLIVIILWIGGASAIEYFLLQFSINKFIKEKTDVSVKNFGYGYSILYVLLFIGLFCVQVLITFILLYTMGESGIEGYSDLYNMYNSINVNFFIILGLQAILHIIFYQKICKIIISKTKVNRVLAFVLIFEFCIVMKFLVNYSTVLTYAGIMIEILTYIFISKKIKE